MSVRRLLLALPVVVFAGLAAIILAQLLSGRDAATIPSALIGQAAPLTRLPPIKGVSLPGLDSAAFAGKVTLVNVWASWCAPCREEHPLLMRLAGDKRFRLAGLNYKDKPEDAAGFLAEVGNPFAAVGSDATGSAGIDWGVYGVPETFLVDQKGVIVWKQVGPFSEASIQRELMPRVEAALAGL